MEKAKIRYDWEFILLKMLKQHATGDLFKGLKYQVLGNLFHGERLKYGTAEDLFY